MPISVTILVQDSRFDDPDKIGLDTRLDAIVETIKLMIESGTYFDDDSSLMQIVSVNVNDDHSTPNSANENNSREAG